MVAESENINRFKAFTMSVASQKVKCPANYTDNTS